MPDDKLEPCPFCKGEARLVAGYYYEQNYVWPQIICLSRKCGCSKQAVQHPWTEAEAVAAWNTRPALDALIAHHKPGPFTGNEREVRDELGALHVWPQFVVADHADVLSPRQIDGLYVVGYVATKALALLDAKDAQLAELSEALTKANRVCDKALTRAEQAEAALADAKQRIDYLEKRLEVVPDWSEDCDGISCRDDTIKLQDERIERLKDALAERDKAMAGVAADLIGYFEEKVPDSPTLNVVRHHLSPFLPKPEVDPLVAKWDAMAAAIKECESKAGPVSPDDLLAALSARNLEVRVKGEE